MITVDQLIKAGYKKYSAPPLIEYQFARAHYQKRFDGPEGILYFIDVFEYAEPIGFDLEAHFTLKNGIDLIVNRQPGDDDLKEIEGFFEQAYNKLGCEPYERTEIWLNV